MNKVDKDKYFISEEPQYISISLDESNTITIKDLIGNNIINKIALNPIFFLRISCKGYIFFEELCILYGYGLYKFSNNIDQRDHNNDYKCDISINGQKLIINFTNFNNTKQFKNSLSSLMIY